MNYAPEDVRTDVANAQARIAHALDDLRDALDDALCDRDARFHAHRGDTDVAEWLTAAGYLDRITRNLTRALEMVEQIDPYAERDERWNAERVTRDERWGNRGAVLVSASPTAPTPADVGYRAFGSSRPETPNTAKRPLDFGAFPETAGDHE